MMADDGLVANDLAGPVGRPAAPMEGSKMRRVDSRALLGSRGELVIVHAGREYRLRITRNDKLILTA